MARKRGLIEQHPGDNQVIDYLTQNGMMDAGRLYEQPLTTYSPLGLDGLFPDADAANIV